MIAYYNENDRFAAAWLRGLIREGLIAPGDVDERDIRDVQPGDLAGYAQCHFFAGIGGWSYALRLAGWDDSRPVWTGSCPCQPFSVAGRRRGFGDSRHLWPAWFRLIRECAPPMVFGEQVAGAAGVAWFAHVAADLEAEGYAIGAADLPAACVGATHRRERLFFVGDRSWPDADRGQAYGRDIGLPLGRIGRAAEDEAVPDPSRTIWATEPRPSPVVDGVSASVGLTCGYGNAIVPEVAAEFVSAYMSVVEPSGQEQER